MTFRYFCDPDTGLPHIYGHGVAEREVEYVLRHPGERRKGSRNSLRVIGQTQSGRYLRVVYTPDAIGNGVFVVTAYEIGGKTLAAYRRRRRKRR